MAGEHVCDHADSTAVAGDMNDHLVVLEHPVPVGAAIDAHRSLVGADDPRATQSGQDRRHFIIETGLGRLEHSILCAFADPQRKVVQEHPRQSPIADRAGKAQVDRQRQDGHVENGVPSSARQSAPPAALECLSSVLYDFISCGWVAVAKEVRGSVIIRAQQMQALGQYAQKAFETRLLGHIRECFPVHRREVGPGRLRVVIRQGIENAARHGMRGQREIYLFVSLMLYFGSSFDTDPQLGWVAAGLQNPSEPDSFLRLEAVYDSAVEYLDRVAGPNGKNTAAAIGRFVEGQTLASLYPEKFRELDSAQLAQLQALGEESAQVYGLDARGAQLMTTLALLLGHGFATDPQFFWAGEVLSDQGIFKSEERGKAMRDAAVRHLQRWLSDESAAA
jgi:hypothetical protein